MFSENYFFFFSFGMKKRSQKYLISFWGQKKGEKLQDGKVETRKITTKKRPIECILNMHEQYLNVLLSWMVFNN